MKTCGSCGQLNLQGPPLRLSCQGCGASLKSPATVREPDHVEKLRGQDGNYRTRPVGAPAHE